MKQSMLGKYSKWTFHALMFSRHMLLPMKLFKGCYHDSCFIQTISSKADSFTLYVQGQNSITKPCHDFWIGKGRYKIDPEILIVDSY